MNKTLTANTQASNTQASNFDRVPLIYWASHKKKRTLCTS